MKSTLRSFVLVSLLCAAASPAFAGRDGSTGQLRSAVASGSAGAFWLRSTG